MVSKLAENPSVRLLKHVVRCYLRLSEHRRARDALKHTLPEALRDESFATVLGSEEAVQRWLTLLLKNLSNSDAVIPATGGGNTTAGNVGSIGGQQAGNGEQGTWQQYASLSESATTQQG